jgi:hypothetical protein
MLNPEGANRKRISGYGAGNPHGNSARANLEGKNFSTAYASETIGSMIRNDPFPALGSAGWR